MFISYEKRSKKGKRRADLTKRKVWEVSPIPKVVESKKRYKRERVNINDFL